MSPYYAFYVARSDGKLETFSSKTGNMEVNCPSSDQLDQTPNSDGVKDYYQLLGENDDKVKEWKRKLGGMLAAHLRLNEGASSDKSYVLADLPEGYKLYEHVKEKKIKSDKSHAAGDADRRDAYLYGHPGGRKSRFRSPADFFNHLLWLIFDEEGDVDNCTCKVCCPETGSPRIKKEGTPIVNGLAQSDSNVHLSSTPSTSTSFSSLPSTSTTTMSEQVSNSQGTTQSPTTQTLSNQSDMNSSVQFHFRTGEMVWLNQSGSYVIGVITGHQSKPDNMNTIRPLYAIQLLSHPSKYVPIIPEAPEHVLKPFRFFQVPVPSIYQEGDKYETINWQNVVSVHGEMCTELEAMKFAAMHIDQTYTLSGSLQDTNSYRRWKTLFLGAEKIFLGDVVSLGSFAPSSNMILIVREIFEDPNHDGASAVSLAGELWEQNLRDLAPDNGSYVPDHRIPDLVRDDLFIRNQFVKVNGGKLIMWTLRLDHYTCDITNVKGRWYHPTYLERLVSSTNALGNRWAHFMERDMNDMTFQTGTCSSLSANRPVNLSRAEERSEAFVGSIPPDCFPEGL